MKERNNMTSIGVGSRWRYNIKMDLKEQCVRMQS
jgi:hypothetical protein